MHFLSPKPRKRNVFLLARLFGALLFASGRRPTNIQKTGCFRPSDRAVYINEAYVDPVDRYECYAYGGEKPGLTKFSRGKLIPLLVPYRIFINGLQRFRLIWGTSEELIEKTRFTSKTSVISKMYKETFQPLVDENLVVPKSKFNLGSREFRAMYARYSWAIFGGDTNFNIWVSNVLFHSKLYTSINYSRVKFPLDNFERLHQIFVPSGIITDESLITLYRNTKKLSLEQKRQHPYKETLLQTKCLGLTLKEALNLVEEMKDKANKKTLQEIVSKFF